MYVSPETWPHALLPLVATRVHDALRQLGWQHSLTPSIPGWAATPLAFELLGRGVVLVCTTRSPSDLGELRSLEAPGWRYVYLRPNDCISVERLKQRLRTELGDGSDTKAHAKGGSQ